MSRSCLLPALFGACLVACGQAPGPVAPAPDPVPELRSGALGAQTSASGQIADWPVGKAAPITLAWPSEQQIGSVAADGRWSFTLDNLARTDQLRPATEWFGGRTTDGAGQPCALNTLRVEPPDARIGVWNQNGLLIGAGQLSAQLSPVPTLPGLVRRDFEQASGRVREVSLVYAAQAVRAQGQFVCRAYPWTGSPVTAGSRFYVTTLAVNLDLKAGWNEMLRTEQPVLTADGHDLAEDRTLLTGGAGVPPIPWIYVGPRP